MKLIYTISLLLFCATVSAQQFKNNVGAPYLGLGAYSSAGSVLGNLSNTANLGFLKNSGAGVFAERRFGLSDLNNVNATAALVTKAGGIGVQFNRFGFNEFNESQVGIGYGRALNDKVSVGAKINYYNQRIPTYGNAGTVNAEAGLLIKLTSRLTSGISVFNPAGGKFGVDNTEKLASVYKLGMGYDVSDKVLVVGEITKTENEPVNFIGMVHYQFEKKFYAKAGVSTAANNLFASAGVALSKNFKLEVSASHHQTLGFTPGIVLVFE